MESPRTPPHNRPQKVPDTASRSQYFWHYDNRRDDELVTALAGTHDIAPSTGYRWRRERALLGSPTANRRIRKVKAAARGQRLGRPFRVDKSVLTDMISPNNPVAERPLHIQAQHYNIPLAERSLRYNLSNRMDARMYLGAYTSEMRSQNYTARQRYGQEHKDKPLYGFWDTIFFTDEAHFNPLETFQRQRILRQAGNQNRIQRLVKKPSRKSLQTVHMASYVNWYYKGPLEFYNDEREMLPVPKPPRKPRRSMWDTDKTWAERLREWEAHCPPELDAEPQGNHMTQDYYTKRLLPGLVAAIHKAHSEDPSRQWILQEDNDPSHGTRSAYNVARDYKNRHGIQPFIHPAQSPDLNPIEGCWLILKQRTKQRLDQTNEWDGSIRHLKQILREEWERITIKEIREIISEMPWRCQQLCQSGGDKIRSQKW
ncbi:hypothetical protein BU23DRAFT_550225 [Bimuria novae-zelandiae CBS 107.79]|uniref:Tc1-like transposase DDE domain-containing protein n=1 Tax=Bimuria novae-zelandiae CBS 107.79 TaxID=1447943 RepID=A0A6A5VN52_9PLEO|nr:hypothetical protein BU23DRAFT_550225 [Bimuria novae-zelandiae CBS 107.79]